MSEEQLKPPSQNNKRSVEQSKTSRIVRNIKRSIEQSKTSQIVRQLMREVDVSEAELARRTRIPQPTLHRILSGATRSPRGDSLSPLANFFSITISQLIGDDPLPKERIPGTYNPGIQGWTVIPLLNWEQATQWPQMKAELMSTQWDQWTSTDAKVSPDSFGLVVSGDAMSPRFADGTVLIVDPDCQAEDGDFIIIHLKGQKTATFKQLKIDGDDRYLKPLNTEFKTTQLVDGEYRILGVMVQCRFDFRSSK